jgi:diaminopimelate decarboxylase
MGVALEFIDLGGGLGIPYHHDTDPAPTPEDYAAAVVPVFADGVAKCGIKPELWVEPGRYLVADSTVLLTRVNSVKKAHKTFVNVDAGFNLPHPSRDVRLVPRSAGCRQGRCRPGREHTTP